MACCTRALPTSTHQHDESQQAAHTSTGACEQHSRSSQEDCAGAIRQRDSYGCEIGKPLSKHKFLSSGEDRGEEA